MKISNKLLLMIFVMCVFILQGCSICHKKTSAKIKPDETPKIGQVKYTITEREPFTVMGILIRVTEAEQTNQTYEKVWKEFEPYGVQLRPIGTDWRYYGVDFATEQQGAFDYIAGMAVRSDSVPPDSNLVVRKVPAARYAMFQCAYKDIATTYKYIFEQWLPGSRYELDKDACSFEQYLPRGRENQLVLINIPIKNK